MLVNKQLISVPCSIIEKMSNFLNNFNIIIQLIFVFVKTFKVSQNGCAVEFHNIYFHPEKNETERLELYIVVNKSRFFRKSLKEKIKGTLPLVRIALILHSLEWKNIIMDRIRRSEGALNSGNLFGFIVDVVKARRLRNNTTQKIQTVNCKY